MADYDCDGATACAVALRGLRMLGGPNIPVQFLVPNRFTMGYGLTSEVVELAAQQIPKPRYLITVDNGIASVAGVDRARELGMEVITEGIETHIQLNKVKEFTCEQGQGFLFSQPVDVESARLMLLSPSLY